MKKRTLAMLLALVLVISIVPVAAMAAAECGHQAWNGKTIEPAGNGKHNILCECGNVVNTVACTNNGSDVCEFCGQSLKKAEPEETTKPAEPEVTTEPKHEHTKTYSLNVEKTGSHYWYCEDKECGASGIEDCTFKGGKCIYCGRHSDDYVEPTKPTEKPTEPKPTETEPKDNCTCTVADASKTGKLVCNNDGTHSLVCEHGKSVNHTTDCVDKNNDGKCDDCGGAMKAEPKPEEPKPTEPKDDCDCTALDAYLTGELVCNNDGTHSLYCKHGNSMNHTTNCVDKDGDGKCDDCGGNMKAETKPDTKPTEPECEHTYEYISYKSNNDGTHTINCKCGYSVVKDCIYNNGECIFCHYNKNAVECDCGPADGVKATYVGEGKHEITCKHGKVVNTTWCSKGDDGCCIGCGHNMEEEEVTTPDDNTKPSTPTEGLDSVPKTGDNGSIIVMGAVAVLALFGGAYVFTKKRAF